MWGIVTLTPLFFLVDVTGRSRSPPPTTYPQFFYGFFAVAMAWQIAFVLINQPGAIPAADAGRHPREDRLHRDGGGTAQSGSISAADATAAVPDLVLCILFVAAFAKTRTSDQRRAWASSPA